MCTSHQATRVQNTGFYPVLSPTGLCADCQAATDAQALSAQRAKSEESERTWGPSSLALISDPYEKVVIACRRYGTVSRTDGQDHFSVRHHREYAAVMKELFPTALDHERQCWPSYALARWFAARAHDAGIPTDSIADFSHWSRRITGGFKERIERVPAWRMPKGWRGQGTTRDSFVLTDGRFTPCAENYPASLKRRGFTGDTEGLNGIACMRMADLLDLT